MALKYNGSDMTSEFAKNSDVSKIQKGSGNVSITSPTVTPPPQTYTFPKEFSSVPTVMIDSMYRHLIAVSGVTKTGFTLTAMNDELSQIDTTFTWVAFE